MFKEGITASVHWNVISVCLLFFIGISLILFIICLRFDFGKSQEASKKIVQSKGPYLFITAHPDDECMFFAPALIQLANHSPENTYLLCLTTGDYYKKGTLRQKEIYKSGDLLGVPPANIQVLNNSAFLDGSDDWDFELLLPEIFHFMTKINPKFVFTFDEKGVSGHPNHISSSKALRRLLTEKECPNGEYPVLLELQTVPLYRKYVSFLDVLPTIASSDLMFVSTPADILKAQKAMLAHWSQMVWFRGLYVLFSRYMLINDYRQVFP